MEHGDKDEVQANIEDGGHGERLERHAGDTDGAEDGGFEVVEQDRGHAQQKDAQVERCERHGLGRDVERGEHGLGKDLAQRDDDKAHERHEDRGVDGALDHVLVVAADGVGDNHVGAKRQANEQVNHQAGKRNVGADRRHGQGSLVAREVADNDCGDEVRQLLEDARRGNGKGEQGNVAPQRAGRHVNVLRCGISHTLSISYMRFNANLRRR